MNYEQTKELSRIIYNTILELETKDIKLLEERHKDFFELMICSDIVSHSTRSALQDMKAES